MGSSLKGGGGGSGGNAAADAQARIAEQLWSQTNPLRESLIGRSNTFLTEGLPADPQYMAFKGAADQNFMRARDNAMSRLPVGGALTDALVDLEGQRANTLTQGAGAIYGSELDRATSLATGGASQASSAFGQAGAIQAQLAASQAQENNGKMNLLGSGFGAYMGSK